MRIYDSNQPHLARILIDESSAEEEIRHSELDCAIRLMKQSVKIDKGAQYFVHPVWHPFHFSSLQYPILMIFTWLFSQVFVYSLSGFKARVLETYYEEGELYVRKSDRVDFDQDFEGSLKLFLPWMLNELTVRHCR